MTYVLPNLDFALIPAHMLVKLDRDFTGLNLQTLFMWMSNYPRLMLKYGFKEVVMYPPEIEDEYISIERLLDLGYF